MFMVLEAFNSALRIWYVQILPHTGIFQPFDEYLWGLREC